MFKPSRLEHEFDVELEKDRRRQPHDMFKPRRLEHATCGGYSWSTSLSNPVEPKDLQKAVLFGFAPAQRIRRQCDFDAVFAARQSAGGGCLVVYGRPNGLAWNRLGISVGRKFGGAVVRNRFKRLCRESFRLSQHEQPYGWDWIVLPKRLGDPKGVKSAKKSGKGHKLRRVPWPLTMLREEMLVQMRRIARRSRAWEKS